MKSLALSVRFLYGILGGVFILCSLLLFSFFRRDDSALSCKDCNIIFIEIDPLRADALKSTGGMREAPTLDALAKRGYTFTNAVAASSWTLPSAMSLMTGVYPSRHGIINKELLRDSPNKEIIPASLQVTAPHITPLVTLFRSHGYATGGFAGGAALDPSYGFADGFDVYESPGDFEDIASSSAKAIDFIRKNKNKKIFVFLHGFDVHGQYMPPQGLDKRFVSSSYKGSLIGNTVEQKELREQGVRQGSVYITDDDAMFLRAIYDEKVSLMDARIGEFLAAYHALGLEQKTVIVFSSHHGEEFYEHGRIDHGMTLYDEVLRVPLIVVLPGGAKGKRIDRQVRNVDILPTILDIVGIPIPARMAELIDGVSVVPLMRGKELKLDAISETSYRYATFQTSLRGENGWKIIYDREQQVKKLYHYAVDPGEVNDRYGQNEPAEQSLVNRILQHINGVAVKR